jgi:hypothetical protein
MLFNCSNKSNCSKKISILFVLWNTGCNCTCTLKCYVTGAVRGWSEMFCDTGCTRVVWNVLGLIIKNEYIISISQYFIASCSYHTFSSSSSSSSTRWTSFSWMFWPSQRPLSTSLNPGRRLSSFGSSSGRCPVWCYPPICTWVFLVIFSLGVSN